MIPSQARFYQQQVGYQLLLLAFWTGIGAVLRFTELAAKPPWTDEFATLVFSLGNHYQSVPLNQVISIHELLQPLQPNPEAGVRDIITLLISEDNHPPLYFVLSYLWLKLFPSGEYVSLWAARSLPALLGTVSIPSIYLLARIAFPSRYIAQLSAAMMAVSPYGVYLAQEARHYTLATLFVIASLGCLAVAGKHLQHRTTIPTWLVLTWVVINSLGIATHYFFSLTLCAEVMTLILLLYWHRQKSGNYHAPVKNFGRIAIAATGTLTTALMWAIFVLPKDYGTQATDWIRTDHTFLGLISPPFQALATWITMLSLLPVEASSLPVVIFSGGVMLLFFIWALPILYQGLKKSWQQPSSQLATQTLVSFVGSAVLLFFGITYFGGIDLTRGARYSFVYFPAVIVLLGASLSIYQTPKRVASPCPKVILIWLMGLISAVTVVSNLGYQKYYRPDLLASVIKEHSTVPVLIATTHRSLVQTGEMMGIAWELNSVPNSQFTFLLAHQEQENSAIATATLAQALAHRPHPLDVWAVNFQAPVDLNQCLISSQLPSISGYSYRLYHCL